MRKTLAIVIIATLNTSVAAEDGVAKTAAIGPGKTEAGLFLGGFISNYFHQFYDIDVMPDREELGRLSPLFGVRFAAFPSRILGVEGEASMILASTKDSHENAKIYGLRVQAVLQRPARLTPFVAAGFGLTYVSSDDSVLGSDADLPIHVGVGARYFATPTVAVRIDARFVRGPSQQDPYTLNASYGEFMLGLSFNPAAPAREVREPLDPDPDGDGVMTGTDECPTEAAPGAANGCPQLDPDGDVKNVVP